MPIRFLERSAPRLAAFARRRPITALLLALALLTCCNIGRYLVWPPVAGLAANNPETTAFMEYRRDTWEAKGLNKKIIQTWKPLKNISPNLRKAVVVAEDSGFWTHSGFDLEGMRHAFKRNLAKRRLHAGGSTITQQLAKNLYFSPDKSITRKLQEALVAKRLEWSLSKERILELYLNCVEWGDGVFGAEAAARKYFGASAANLTAHQAATLAAMLPSPLKRKPSSRIVRKEAGTIMARMRIE